MLINSQQSTWATSTLVAAALAGAGYVVYANSAAHGVSGGSAEGLTFGIAGTALMTLAALLSLRKRVIWRIGSAHFWMKLHIWCSALAVPLILFHSGFRLGGALTTTMMLLFALVVSSGVLGLVLQQFVPAMMTRRLSSEPPHSQLDHVGTGLAIEAYEIVAHVAGIIEEAKEERAALAAEEALLQARPGNWKNVPRRAPATEVMPAAGSLRAFYLTSLRPYLRRRPRARMAPPDFRPLRLVATDEWRGFVDRLAEICDESAQLTRQRRLHAWLHGWLFLHVPLSFALYALIGVHIYYALRY